MAQIEHVLDIKVSKEELEKMTPEQHEKFIDTILESMTVEQKIKMTEIGIRVVRDDIIQRTKGRSRTALRTMARSVNVTVNGVWGKE